MSAIQYNDMVDLVKITAVNHIKSNDRLLMNDEWNWEETHDAFLRFKFTHPLDEMSRKVIGYIADRLINDGMDSFVDVDETEKITPSSLYYHCMITQIEECFNISDFKNILTSGERDR